MGLLDGWRRKRERADNSDPAEDIRAYYEQHRHPSRVITQILEQIPDGEYEELRRKLRHISEQAYFTPPERMQLRWVSLMDTLQKELGTPDTPWKMRIVAIMNNGQTPPQEAPVTMNDIHSKYTTAAILCHEGISVYENLLHYMAVIPLQDGSGFMLVPTQGKLVHVGEVDGKPVWAYLRYNRRPMFVCEYYAGIMDVLNAPALPAELLARGEELAQSLEVYDRRHVRVDHDYSTPGEPTDAVI